MAVQGSWRKSHGARHVIVISSGTEAAKDTLVRMTLAFSRYCLVRAALIKRMEGKHAHE